MLPTKKTVLLVDDDRDSCEMLPLFLACDSFEVQIAGSAAEALDRRETERFDLFVIDACLPIVSGFELCLRLREIDYQTPIVFYSGSDTNADKKRGIAAGAQSYLIKPDIEGLKATILDLLSHSKARPAGG